MKTNRTNWVLSGVAAAVIMLAACDAPANDPAATVSGDDLPAASSVMPFATDSVETPMEAVTGDEIVTEYDLPHSDVPPPSREVFVNPDCEFEEWIGQAVDEDAVNATGRPHRILAPGSVMTMDHRPDRINVEHDDSGIVTRVWCG